MVLAVFSIWLISLNLIGSVRGNQQVTLYSEDFAPPVDGWTLIPNTDTWEIGSMPTDHSGNLKGLGTELSTGLGYTDNVNQQIEATMPVVNLEGYSNIHLSFYQYYYFSDSLNDGGGIYLWNGSDFINPLNDYPSAVSGDLNFYVVAGLAYTGHPNEKGWAYNSTGLWRQVIIDLSAIGINNSDFQVTFVFGETGADIIHGTGWYIDDIEIIGERPQGDSWWIWIIFIIGTIISLGTVYYYTRKSPRSTEYEIGDKTTPAPAPPTVTTSTPTTPPVSTPPPPVPVQIPPTVKWWRTMGDYESENPLYENGYSYDIVFEVPCTITPAPDQVIVVHVVITVTVQCKNGPHSFTYDYWEAFTLHDPKNDKTTTPDKHYVDRNDLEKQIMNKTGCDQILSYTVTRTHTANLGTVAGADWNGTPDGGQFAYLRNGPPPENKPSTPSSRPDSRVQGNVTSFSTTGATTFTGTYTYNAQTGSSTYTSSNNPGTTYTYP